VRRDPRLVARLVDETLRLESPVQKLARWPDTDMRLGTVEIPRDAPVVLVLGAGNRDPARFPDPDRCDLDRATGGHLGFGRGAHFCLGSALARLEAESVLGCLAERFDRIEAVPGGFRWLGNSSFRGLAELRLVFS
jgi:cytochrome P450